MLAPSTATSGPTSSPPRWAASSDDRKIKVGVRIRLVFERVVPPLAVVRAEADGLHDRAQAAAVARLELRETPRPMMRDRVHEVVVAAHARELARGQVIQR